jgi:hypothetical protein
MIQQFQQCLESRFIEVMKMKMLAIQFVSSVNLIQMKLMKVLYNMKNILIQQFQQSLELRLSEVMTHKILAGQFVSRANLIQI